MAFLFSTFFVSAELNLELPDLNLPDLGVQSGSFGSSAKMKQQGLTILRKFRRSNRMIEDPEVNTWIRSLGYKLTANAPQSSSPLYFLVSKDQSVNAFATLGGVIVINAGLILRTNSESELAAVIAHEVAHVTQNHIARMIENASGNKLATGAAILVGVLASTKDSQAGQAILSATMATMAYKQLSFNREAEAEADRVGLRILARSGFNPLGMPNFLRKLEQYNSNRDANITEYLRSHPLTLRRVSDTQVRAKKFGAFRGRENISYQYMREKIRVLVNSRVPTPNALSASIKKYATNLKLKRQRKYQYALKLIGQSSRKIPEAILIAQLLNAQRRYQQTVRLLRPLIAIYPGDEALSQLLAQAYLALGQISKAWSLINEVNLSEQTSLEFFDVQQNVARLARKTSQAYRAVANRNTRIGEYKAAALQLRKAIKLPDASGREILELQRELSLVEFQIKQNKKN